MEQQINQHLSANGIFDPIFDENNEIKTNPIKDDRDKRDRERAEAWLNKQEA